MANTPPLPLDIAMIGVGAVSRRHVPAFLERPEAVRLAAVCDTNLAAAEDFAAKIPGDPRIVTRHEELLDASKIDAVVIALPHFLHFPVATDFVEAGIPVLIEKPLTCTLDETRRLRDHAAERGVAVVSGQMRRFNREATWLKRWVDADPEHFGELRSFDIHSWQNIASYVRSGTEHWLLDGQKAGGGVVISLAVHQLDLLRFIAGVDYVRVHAQGRYDPPFHNGAESMATVLLEMDNGASGVLHATYTAPRTPYSEAMNLFGASGTIIQRVERIGQYHGPFQYATVKGRETTEWEHQYQDFEAVPVAEVADLSENPFVNQLEHFAMALHQGRTPANNVNENFNTMACIQAIHDSLSSGEPEAVART